MTPAPMELHFDDKVKEKYPKIIAEVLNCKYELQNHQGETSFAIKMEVRQTAWPTSDHSYSVQLVYGVFHDAYATYPPSLKKNGTSSVIYIPYEKEAYREVMSTLVDSNRAWVQYFQIDENTIYADIHGETNALVSEGLHY